MNAWDPNTFVPGDPSTYLIREQPLGVFTVEAVPVSPEGLVAMPGDLGVRTVTFTPNVMEIGQAAQGLVAIPNLADFPFTVRQRVRLLAWLVLCS